MVVSGENVENYETVMRIALADPKVYVSFYRER
jgi:hypothetical protein